VNNDCFDQGMMTGVFLPTLLHGPSAPMVICIGDAARVFARRDSGFASAFAGASADKSLRSQ
jgi:hypothetical protein